MLLDDATMAKAPEPIRRRYEAATGADRERWGRALLATVQQRAHVPVKPTRPATLPESDGAPSDAWLAPLRDTKGAKLTEFGWEGAAKVKPWQYRVTAVVVHLDAPEPLAVCLDTLRAQTERPYLLVIDAGSHERHRKAVEAMEAEDCEVAFLRPRGWRATSEPVAAAMDVAFALAQTDYVFATHIDVFLKRRDALSDWVGQCDASTPVVGYQMSPRPAWGSDLWREIPSHTATTYHMPTMRRMGARWSMIAAAERLGIPHAQPYHTGFPDTEVNLGLQLQEWGVRRWDAGQPRPMADRCWLNLGPEENEPYETPDLVHVRSYSGMRLYGSEGQNRQRKLDAAMDEARARVRDWATPGMAETRALWRRIRACPHRDECGCTKWTCRHRGERVGRDECATCPILPE
jgi:hypothetical protein